MLNKIKDKMFILEELVLNSEVQGNDLRVAILHLNDDKLTKSELCSILNLQKPNIYPILNRLNKAGLHI
jgi:predicted transcriptional regulator